MKKITNILKTICLFVTSIIIATPTYAIVNTEVPEEGILDMFNQNGIYYYNPVDPIEDTCNIASTTMLSGDTVAEKIWNFFIQQGFTDAQVAGILGNAIAESGLSPTRSGNGSYFGLFQWGGGRKDRLFKKLQDAGLSKYTTFQYWPSGADSKIPASDHDKLLQVELEFAMEETDMNWQSELKQSDTPELSAEIFLTLFERAVNGESEIEYYTPKLGQKYQATKKRREAAKEFYENYAGKGVQNTKGLSSIAENGKNITIIGDSITVRSKDTLKQKFTEISETDLNGRSSRPWNEGVDIAKNTTLKDTVVFALGTNTPSLTKAQAETAITTIGANKKIVLVTNYDGGNKERFTNNNNILKDLAKANANISIADWAEAVDKNPSTYLESDKIHPNPTGAELFANIIWESVNSNVTENGCTVSGEFQSLVQAYAWPDFHPEPWHDRMPAYAEAVSKSISEGRYVGGSVAGIPGIDCGGFVTILVQNSGIEPNYNDSKGGTDTQESWAKAHGWQLLNSSPNTPVDTSLLQPGDVAFSYSHTFIYVGEIPGFNSNIASASYSDHGAGRAPMAGSESLTYGNGSIVRWYRKN